MRRILLLILLLSAFWIHGSCEDVGSEEIVVESHGIEEISMLFDMDLEQMQRVEANASILLEQDTGLGYLYLILDREYGSLTLTDELGAEIVLPTEGILHFLIDLEACFGRLPHRLSLCFSDGEAEVNELRVFTPGALPDWVQRWERIPDGEADLVLFSTHGDDEQLFFAGLLPWYAQDRQLQVVYFTDHRNMTSHRVHEMLNGLWAVGVRYYPVFGAFADYYTFDREDAYRFYQEQGFPEKALLSFVVEQLRRFRPLVAVGHDLEGEYGHGMHQLYADLLCKASACSADPEAFPELAKKYGVWDVPKTYLHLYPENRITMDWDIPMEKFGGRTAYEVSRDDGFGSHVSQQKDFAWYFRGMDTAAEIPKYSPCRYGLYRSTVGADETKNDFFENLGPKQREEPIPEPVTEPIAEAEEQPEATERERTPITPAEENWLIFPAVGTMVLAVLTSSLNLPKRKEN